MIDARPVRPFTFIVLLAATVGCHTTDTLRSLPIKSGDARTYQEPPGQLVEASASALSALEYSIPHRERTRHGSVLLLGSSHQKGFGSVARIIVEPITGDTATSTVRMVVRSRRPLKLTRPPAATDSLFQKIGLALQSRNSVLPGVIPGSQIRLTRAGNRMSGRVIVVDSHAVALRAIPLAGYRDTTTTTVALTELQRVDLRLPEFHRGARARRYRLIGAVAGMATGAAIAAAQRESDGVSGFGAGGFLFNFFLGQAHATNIAVAGLAGGAWGAGGGYALGYLSAPRWTPVPIRVGGTVR